jgi:hypothetical protein
MLVNVERRCLEGSGGVFIESLPNKAMPAAKSERAATVLACLLHDFFDCC